MIFYKPDEKERKYLRISELPAWDLTIHHQDVSNKAILACLREVGRYNRGIR